MPSRPRTTHFLLSFVVVLVLAPALVWGIQAISRDAGPPAPADDPVVSAEPPRHDALGCTVITAPDSAAERAAACETEPPRAKKKERTERPEPRRGRLVSSAVGGTETCTAACETGSIETVDEAAAPVDITDEAREAIDVVGAIPPLARVLPLDRLDEVEERLGRLAPDEVVDAPTDILEDALVPDVQTPPEIEIELDPAPVEPPAEPPAELPAGAELPAPPVDPPAADPVLTTLLVLDEDTAEELDLPSRMTVELSPRVQDALAILSKRMGLELSASAADSPAPPRD